MEGDDDGPEGQPPARSIRRVMGARLPYPPVIRAVFFDWGNTLVAWEFDPELFVEGHARGPRRVRSRRRRRRPAFTDAYSRAAAAAARSREREDEIDYAAEIGDAARALGVRGGRARRSMRFVVAEQRVWRPAHHLEPAVVELLDALRGARAEGRPRLEPLRPAGTDAGALRRDRAARAARCDRALGRGRQAEAAPADLRVRARAGGRRAGEARDGRRPPARGRRRVRRRSGCATVQALWFAARRFGVLGRRPMRVGRRRPADVLRLRSAQPENGAFVKSCGERTGAVTIPEMTDSLLPTTTHRAAAAAAGRGGVPALRGALRQGRLPRVRASSARARSSTPTRRSGTRTWGACSGCSTSRSTSTCCARPSAGATASAPSWRARRRCRCATPRWSRATSSARRGRLPQPRVLRDAGREPELPRLRAARTTDARRRAARRRAASAASSGPSACAWASTPACSSRSRASSAASGPCPSGPGVSRIAGSSWKAGWARNVCSPSPISPRPIESWRSRFEPSASFESLTCRQRSRSSPIWRSRSATAASSAAGVGDVDARRVPVAGVEAEPEPRVMVERVVDRGELVGRAADRAAGAGRVLHQQPEVVGRQLEQLAERGNDLLEAGLEALRRDASRRGR